MTARMGRIIDKKREDDWKEENKMTAREALQTYFGYEDFRPGQAEIIESVLAGNDTLALMPTGGGKSVCFQVPTLVLGEKAKKEQAGSEASIEARKTAWENSCEARKTAWENSCEAGKTAWENSSEAGYKAGENSSEAESEAWGAGNEEGEGCLCMVVTPLIALMKDQVENLKRRDIRAAAIYTGMTREQQRTALDNCQFGPYRFLYVSPERLESEEFIKRVVQLPIRLIAVDEAHCISEWGHDFRPAYRKIATIRQVLPDVPILALTATATPETEEDIMRQLAFRTKNVFRQSFHRDNLRYEVAYTEKKGARTIELLDEMAGSAIIYVRNRKRCEELAVALQSAGIKAEFYHAGLDSKERALRQERWQKDEIRVIVCTNAFGMGIDKPNVRQVIHIDLPSSIESYFQEAGRAGRDGEEARAVLLYNATDKTKARKRVHDNFPPKEFTEQVYHKTCDYLQVGAGSGLGHTFFLDFMDLCRVMKLPQLPTYSALQMLTLAGYIRFQDEQEIQPRVRINVPRESLYEYTFTFAQEQVLNSLMRHYTGIFSDLQYLHQDVDPAILKELAQRGVITYIGAMRACPLTMTQERQTEIVLSAAVYDERANRYINRLRAMVEYAEQDRFCREQVLLGYFGESGALPCGKCDVCAKI